MRVALQRTSRSKGKVIPKLSESVKASLRSPVHCLEMLPTSFSPSGVNTLNSTSPQQEMTQKGPSMTRETLRSASVISNLDSNNLGRLMALRWTYLGVRMDHFWTTYPMVVPGGDWTSSSWRKQGKKHEEQRSGL